MKLKRGEPEITVVNGQKIHRIKKDVCRGFLSRVIRECGMNADQVSVLFTDDAVMRKYNREYRHEDRTTDVISFPAGGKNMEGLVNIGDIVISVPAAFRQAQEAGWSLEKEIKKLLVHGLLHLAGFNHETDGGKMKKMENVLCKKLIAGRSMNRW